MNKCFLMGRMTADPDITYTPSNNTIARFSLAVEHFSNGETKTSFFELSALGKVAETIGKFGKKGLKILADCNITQNIYTDKEGKKHYTYNIVLNSFDFCESKKFENSKE